MRRLLELRDVHTYYGNIHALKGISLTVDQGEIVTLIGANGAGKSTTLKTISGLLRPRQGEITFDGARIDGVTAARDRRASASASRPRDAAIFPRMSVRENLEMGAFQRPKGAGDDGRLRAGLRRSSRGSGSGAARTAGRCRAASSRCWPSAGR